MSSMVEKRTKLKSSLNDIAGDEGLVGVWVAVASEDDRRDGGWVGRYVTEQVALLLRGWD